MERLKDILEKKFNTEFKDKIDPNKYFFGHVINNIETLDAKDIGYAEHNFSGLHSVSNNHNSIVIADYLTKHLNIKGKHCDIGASIAKLSEVLINKGFDSYAIDGHDYGIRHNNILIPLNKYCVYNASTTDISDLDIYKYFEITTAFEITEHISKDEIETFYNNCSYMSKMHLCSVHWGGDDNAKNPDHNHYNVKPVKWWLEFLNKYGEAIVVPVKLKGFTESSIILVYFK